VPNIPFKTSLHQKPKRGRGKKQLRRYGDRLASSAFATLIKSEGRAYRREEEREDRGRKIREWITIGLIALTFVAICYQVHEMIKVYEPIERQAVAANKSANIASDTAKRQLRSYVLYEHGKILRTETAFEAEVIFKNTGQTPAYNVTTFINVDLRDTLKEPIDDPTQIFEFKETGVATSDVGSNGIRRLKAGLNFDSPFEPFFINAGRKTIYVWGTVKYRDIFHPDTLRCQVATFLGKRTSLDSGPLEIISQATTGGDGSECYGIQPKARYPN
jgi:hypothetical protein